MVPGHDSGYGEPDGANNPYLYDGAPVDRSSSMGRDAEGRICAVQNLLGGGPMTQYLYDAEGTRVAKGTITNWSAGCNTATNGFIMTTSYILGPGNEQLTELAWSGGVPKPAHSNVFAAGQVAASYSNSDPDDEPSGILYFQLTDWLGTRRVGTDSAGNTAEVCHSLPFGDGEDCSPLAPTEHIFTGKERDAESGNDYFEARYYSSAMGRFMSPDWSAKEEPVPYAKLDNPQTLNLYSYVQNNPLTRVDADGHCGDGEDGACSKTLSVSQVTNIVVNETQSLHGPDATLSDAHQSVAHAIINGDNAKGENRPITASDKVSAATQQTQSYKDTKADVQCACQDAAKGVDPTNGAQNFNLRPNDSTKPFQGADIQTQSGPFTNSYPTKDLPKTGIYVNTYKQPTPAPKPPPPPPQEKKQPQ